MSDRRTIGIAVLIVAAAFVSGLLAGIFLGAYHIRPFGGRGIRGAMVQRLDRALDLSPAQRTQIESILQRRQSRIETLRGETEPRIRAEIEATNAEIERLLTPEQREKFKKMRMHMRGRRRGPPPG